MTDPFWERPEVVEQFATRPPDHRLLRLIERFPRPETTRVLDLGCAGGRNSVLLTERGFDLWAIDRSAAMVARARDRLAMITGPDTAAERVLSGRMDDLSRFADEFFDLVVALGIYHGADSRAEWDDAVAETVRVLKRGGLALVNQFSPEVDLTGEGVRAVEAEPDVYEGLADGRGVLMDAATLDRAMSSHGLIAEVPSETVRVPTERGRRVSVNALYSRV